MVGAISCAHKPVPDLCHKRPMVAPCLHIAATQIGHAAPSHAIQVCEITCMHQSVRDLLLLSAVCCWRRHYTSRRELCRRDLNAKRETNRLLLRHCLRSD